MSSPKYDFEALKALKTKRNLSAQALSDLSGVPVSTVNRVLRGEGDPGISTVVSLVHAMGGSLDEVCGFPRQQSGMDDRLFQVMQDTIRNKEKWLIRAVTGCAVLVLFILGLFAYDFAHPDRGWFQLEDGTSSGSTSQVVSSYTEGSRLR